MLKKALIQALTGTSHIVCESIETDNTTGAMYYSTSGWKKSIPLRNLPEKISQVWQRQRNTQVALPWHRRNEGICCRQSSACMLHGTWCSNCICSLGSSQIEVLFCFWRHCSLAWCIQLQETRIRTHKYWMAHRRWDNQQNLCRTWRKSSESLWKPCQHRNWRNKL